MNRSGRLHVRDGQVVGHSGKLSIPPIALEPVLVRLGEALERGRAFVPGRGERAPPRAERGWLAVPGRTIPIWRVTLTTVRPLGTWQINIDARSGDLVSSYNLLRTYTGLGRTYEENVLTTPNPVDVALEELDASGFLRGRITQVFDVREAEAFRPDGEFIFDPPDPRFTQTSVYRGLTDAALYAETHGIPTFNERILTFTNLFGGPMGEEFNNAFYDPFFPIIGFGNGDGVLTANLATDLDVAIHEMGHHVFQTLVDPLGSSSLRRLADINEGFSDSLAAFLTADPALGESAIPGQPHMRTLENSATWPADADSDPHIQGLIFGGLNWDLANQLGIDLAAEIVLASLPFLDPEADFPWQNYREALLQGEQSVTGGTHRTIIATLADERGLIGLPISFAGILDEGVVVEANLGDTEFVQYLFGEFPDSTAIRFEANGTPRLGVFVGPLATIDFDDASTYMFEAADNGTAVLSITRDSQISVDTTDSWSVLVADYRDDAPTSFDLTVTSEPPEPLFAVGESYAGTLEEPGDFSYVTFAGNEGDIVRLEATALAEDLDVAVSIFDLPFTEVLGGDDDSGPDDDALIQGAALPKDGTYGIAVYSIIADIDPRKGSGDYRLDLSLCSNVGPDFDSDGLVDTCDDDDDQDGFRDADDTEPLDALRCQDVEGDGCDDCTNGDFDPFNDGDNADGDHLCDDGDPDDDNDGCEDSIDSHPFDPSVDDDYDLIGEDCDNCPDVYNPEQADCNDNGSGDLCDLTECPEPDGRLALLVALVLVAAMRRTHGT